jgi:IPT/TIG domain
MRKSQSSSGRRLLKAGLATGAAAAVAVAAAATPAFAAAAITLSATSGPSAGGNTLTGTSTTNFLTGYTAPVAYFTQAACPATWTSSALSTVAPSASNTGVTPATTVKKLANNKVAVTVPAAVVTIGSAASNKYNLCVYGAATASTPLAANAAYTVATAASVSGVTPSAGPALGGSVITVTGSAFPTTAGSITATLGGTPLTNVTPVNATSFTAVTPAHAPANDLTLSVTTTSGTVSVKNAFDYVNGIVVAPNTAPNTASSQDVDVIGTNFLNYSFPASPTASDSHVYLVNGVYNGLIGTGGANKANGPVAECGSVLVVGDTELICTLDLTRRLDAAGAVVTTGQRSVSNAVTVASSNLVTSTTANFTQADVGLPITETGNTHVAAGTTIVAVLNPTTAVLSANAASAGTGVTVNIGYRNTALSGTTAANSNQITSVTGGTLSQSDVGRSISGTGIPNGATITAVNTAGTTATISANATSANTGTGLTIESAYAVPNGAYTMTVVSNGATNAASTDANYSQTTVSSGSTFTVAPF